jgi:chemotaxis receptor (MCP) glutamine deamidase CheD
VKTRVAVAGPVMPGRPAREVTIYIGGVHASEEPTVIKTLLGSCIAVCLWDSVRGIGGMNHFMLPRSSGRIDGDAARFGVHAMDCLIGAMMKLGADRRRFVAKVFGGAHVLAVRESEDGVPQQNIAFIREFLADEGLPVLGEDVGGYTPRHVHFHTDSGRALVKRLNGPRSVERVVRHESQVATRAPRPGDVVLWDQP